MKQLFQVRYAWTKGGKEYTGRTVVTAKSQAEAEAKFHRDNKHVTVVPHVEDPSAPSDPSRPGGAP